MKLKSTSIVLREFLPYRLSVVTNRISSLIASTYSERFNIRIPEWRVIAILGEQSGLNGTEISKRTAMDKVTVTRAIQALESKGHVSRFPSKTDGRVSHFALNDSGERIYSEIAPVALNWESVIKQALSDDDLRGLDQVLIKLSNRLDELEKEDP